MMNNPQLLSLIVNLSRPTQSGGPRGYDSDKKIKGRKRHIVTATAGNLLEAVVHEANIQDRDGAVSVLSLLKTNYPTVTRIYADGGYAGEKLQKSIAHLGELGIHVIKRVIKTKILSFCPRDGWLREYLHGLIAVDVEPKTGNVPRPHLSIGYLSLQSEECLAPSLEISKMIKNDGSGLDS